MSQVSPAPSAPAIPALDAEIAIEDDRWRSHPDPKAAVQAAVCALVAANPAGLGQPSAATIVLSDDARVSALNATFRRQPVPTNVLSFPAAPGASEPGEPAYLGDVIIARETVEREAEAAGICLAHHLQHLTIHGVLHLLGYDHDTDARAEIMEALETQVLASLGVADPYASETAISPGQTLPLN